MPDSATMYACRFRIILRNLARIDGDVALEVAAPVTLRSVLDALEARYPMLCGTIRDTTHSSGGRFCASSRVKKTCRTSRRMSRCRRRWRRQGTAADHWRDRRRVTERQ